MKKKILIAVLTIIFLSTIFVFYWKFFEAGKSQPKEDAQENMFPLANPGDSNFSPVVPPSLEDAEDESDGAVSFTDIPIVESGGDFIPQVPTEQAEEIIAEADNEEPEAAPAPLLDQQGSISSPGEVTVP